MMKSMCGLVRHSATCWQKSLGLEQALLAAQRPLGSRCAATGTRDLPSEVDVAIIGGGVVGVSILHQLGVQGLGSSAALFEKATLTSGAL